ncbi:MAG TPA: LLM class F420-dependent oxidoreductase [Thermoleophilaceae bacterium]
MKYGAAIFATDYSVDPARFAQMAEERGYDSVFFPEHTHIPASRDTPYPGGGDLPEQYWHTHDLFVSLMAAAAATERVKIGSGICLVTERDPIVTAKEVASVDVLSGGRMIFGIGAGWNLEELRNHGTDPSTRFRLMRERVEAMKAIWTEDEAEYHGELVDFGPIWSWPKPLQKPHPPVMIGGMGRRVVERVLAYGDGWFPQPGRLPHEEFMGRLEELRRACQNAGRELPEVTAFGAKPDPALIEDYAAAGVTRTVFWLPSVREDELSGSFDRIAARIEPSPGGN